MNSSGVATSWSRMVANLCGSCNKILMDLPLWQSIQWNGHRNTKRAMRRRNLGLGDISLSVPTLTEYHSLWKMRMAEHLIQKCCQFFPNKTYLMNLRNIQVRVMVKALLRLYGDLIK